MTRYLGYMIVVPIVLLGALIWLGITLVNCVNTIPIRHL